MDDAGDIKTEDAAVVAAFDGAVLECLAGFDHLIAVGQVAAQKLEAVRKGVVGADALRSFAVAVGLEGDELAFRAAVYRLATGGVKVARDAVDELKKRPGPSRAGVC